MSEHGNLSASDERALHAYYDDELGRLSRWWWKRRLARSATLRTQLDAIRALGEGVRQAGSSGPEVDLWDRIALSLPAADARRAEGRSPALPGDRTWGLARPIFAAVATAAVAVAIVVGTIGDTPVRDSSVVRWLDTGGRSVIVLEQPEDATIVWLLDPPSEGARRGGLREAV